MDARLLAVDVGGTSTRAVVVSPDGRCHGYAVAGAGNPTSAGPEAAAKAILAAAAAAASAAGIGFDELDAAVAGIAGASGAIGAALLGELTTGGLTLELGADLLACFHSGTAALEGYALVAGTGAVGARVRWGEIEQLVDGVGWLVGDDGSGFSIGHAVVRAALAALDGRGPPTALAADVLDEFGIGPGGSSQYGRPGDVAALVERIYLDRPVALARLAPLAFRRDDEVADAIVADAVAALVRSAKALLDEQLDGPFVFGGSVLAQPTVGAPVAAALGLELVVAHIAAGATRDDFAEAAAPEAGAAVAVVVPDGIVGAAVLALRRQGVDVDGDLHHALTESIAARRQARSAAAG